MMLSRKNLGKVALLILAALSGVALGLGVREVMSKQAKSDASIYRDSVLANTDSNHSIPVVGDTLSDHCFESLEGDSIRLSELVAGSTYLIFVLPSCQECLDEIRMISEMTSDSIEASRFLFISTVNPRLLVDIRNSMGQHLTFLYDHRSKWRKEQGIEIIPFSLRIDGHRAVTGVVPGALLKDEVLEVLHQQRMTGA